MATRSKGFRKKTKKKLRKSPRDKTTTNQYLREFLVGDKVLIMIEPSSHKAMPHPRFKGKSGVVKDKRGKSYVIEVRDGGLKKTVISTPEHLRPL